MKETKTVKYRVTLTDGCSWIESRPARIPITEGELRTCGHPEHYPNQFPAHYEFQGYVIKLSTRD